MVLSRQYLVVKGQTLARRTDLSAGECLCRLREETDIGKRTLFALSGFKGRKPVFHKIRREQVQALVAPLLPEQLCTVLLRFSLDPKTAVLNSKVTLAWIPKSEFSCGFGQVLS